MPFSYLKDNKRSFNIVEDSMNLSQSIFQSNSQSNPQNNTQSDLQSNSRSNTQTTAYYNNTSQMSTFSINCNDNFFKDKRLISLENGHSLDQQKFKEFRNRPIEVNLSPIEECNVASEDEQYNNDIEIPVLKQDSYAYRDNSILHLKRFSVESLLHSPRSTEWQFNKRFQNYHNLPFKEKKEIIQRMELILKVLIWFNVLKNKFFPILIHLGSLLTNIAIPFALRNAQLNEVADLQKMVFESKIDFILNNQDAQFYSMIPFLIFTFPAFIFLVLLQIALPFLHLTSKYLLSKVGVEYNVNIKYFEHGIIKTMGWAPLISLILLTFLKLNFFTSIQWNTLFIPIFIMILLYATTPVFLWLIHFLNIEIDEVSIFEENKRQNIKMGHNRLFEDVNRLNNDEIFSLDKENSNENSIDEYIQKNGLFSTISRKFKFLIHEKKEPMISWISSLIMNATFAIQLKLISPKLYPKTSRNFVSASIPWIIVFIPLFIYLTMNSLIRLIKLKNCSYIEDNIIKSNRLRRVIVPLLSLLKICPILIFLIFCSLYLEGITTINDFVLFSPLWMSSIIQIIYHLFIKNEKNDENIIERKMVFIKSVAKND